MWAVLVLRRCEGHEAPGLVIVELFRGARVCGVRGLENRLRSSLTDFVVKRLQPTVRSIKVTNTLMAVMGDCCTTAVERIIFSIMI